VYLVERVGLAVARYIDRSALHPSGGESGPNRVPVRAFADRAQAEACRDALEEEARQSASPVQFIAYDLPVSGREVESALCDLGLPPPELGADPVGYDYQARRRQVAQLCEWWAEHAAEMSAEQRAALWGRLFSEWRFYDVAELTVRD
jgi:hypothetical protein